MTYETNKITNIDLLNVEKDVTEKDIINMFKEFLSEFKSDGESYFTKMENNKTQNINVLKIELEHINAFNETLYYYLTTNLLELLYLIESELGISIEIVSNSIITKIRDIKAHKVNKIIKIEGIVVSASSIYTKPREVALECRTCSHRMVTREAIPRRCQNSNGMLNKNTKEECPIDPYVVVPEHSTVEDVQYMKIQEQFEDIPMGETPRHFSVQLSKHLPNSVSPGCRVKLTGVLVVKSRNNKNNNNSNKHYMHVLGVEHEKQKIKKAFTEKEEIQFTTLKANTSSLYDLIVRSIAPNIFGKDEVKKALACMLFGGSRKVNEDGICLRGDINVLLLGDPGIAKSQFLKFMEMVSPISVYTSGRGSSAAGLTASVLRDTKSEGGKGFYLEGGALVLADRGICCIDEFDKMNESDRVSIHEAMEQQSISIAKAGITTVLNTRTAILAAANPVFGRYDDYKTPAENIEFGSTILSRFDLIFILKDKYSSEDKETAKHVLNVHSTKSTKTNVKDSKNDSEEKVKKEKENILSVEFLRNYVQYAKSKVNPILSEEAAHKLNRFYVSIRQQVDEYERESSKKSSVPITVRQLESLIRISEALARMELTNTVTSKHVDEAIRLFQFSTMNAVSQGHQIEGMTRSSWMNAMFTVIEKIKEHLPVGSSKKLIDLEKDVNADEKMFKKTVEFMIRKNKLVSKDHGKVVVRVP